MIFNVNAAQLDKMVLQVYDDTTESVVHEYTVTKNPMTVSEYVYKNITRVNGRNINGNLKYKAVRRLRNFRMSFINISEAQKTALRTIFDYQTIIRFFYRSRESATRFAWCEWVNGFNAVKKGIYYDLSFDLKEIR